VGGEAARSAAGAAAAAPELLTHCAAFAMKREAPGAYSTGATGYFYIRLSGT